MIAMGAHVRCPLCGVDIPCPIAETPDTQGMTVTVDMDAVQEHYTMHRLCTCPWEHGTITAINNECPVHT